TAAASSAPSPNVLVTSGSRSAAVSRCRPQAWADSTYAVSLTTSTAPTAGRPSGSVVCTGTVCPSSTVDSTSTNPGPPSDIGSRTSSSSGATWFQPARIASAASTAVSVPSKASGATTTRTRAVCHPRARRKPPNIGRNPGASWLVRSTPGSGSATNSPWSAPGNTARPASRGAPATQPATEAGTGTSGSAAPNKASAGQRTSGSTVAGSKSISRATYPSMSAVSK